MDLKTFISTVLVQIVEGVRESNDLLAESGAVANPPRVSVYRGEGGATACIPAHKTSVDRHVELVQFDVAVMATESQDSRGGLAIASIISLAASHTSKESNRSESRIQFAIPLLLAEGADRVPVKPREYISPQELQAKARQ